MCGHSVVVMAGYLNIVNFHVPH